MGWADVRKYYLTNPISGAWAGSYFANTEKWNAVPDASEAALQARDQYLHYYRQHWYWAGEANYRTNGGPLELTSIPMRNGRRSRPRR